MDDKNASAIKVCFIGNNTTYLSLDGRRDFSLPVLSIANATFINGVRAETEEHKEQITQFDNAHLETSLKAAQIVVLLDDGGADVVYKKHLSKIEAAKCLELMKDKQKQVFIVSKINRAVEVKAQFGVDVKLFIDPTQGDFKAFAKTMRAEVPQKVVPNLKSHAETESKPKEEPENKAAVLKAQQEAEVIKAREAELARVKQLVKAKDAENRRKEEEAAKLAAELKAQQEAAELRARQEEEERVKREQEIEAAAHKVVFWGDKSVKAVAEIVLGKLNADRTVNGKFLSSSLQIEQNKNAVHCFVWNVAEPKSVDTLLEFVNQNMVRFGQGSMIFVACNSDIDPADNHVSLFEELDKPENFEQQKTKIQTFAQDNKISPAVIMETKSNNNDGIDELKENISNVAKAKQQIALPRASASSYCCLFGTKKINKFQVAAAVFGGAALMLAGAGTACLLTGVGIPFAAAFYAASMACCIAIIIAIELSNRFKNNEIAAQHIALQSSFQPTK